MFLFNLRKWRTRIVSCISRKCVSVNFREHAEIFPSKLSAVFSFYAFGNVNAERSPVENKWHIAPVLKCPCNIIIFPTQYVRGNHCPGQNIAPLLFPEFAYFDSTTVGQERRAVSNFVRHDSGKSAGGTSGVSRQGWNVGGICLGRRDLIRALRCNICLYM